MNHLLQKLMNGNMIKMINIESNIVPFYILIYNIRFFKIGGEQSANSKLDNYHALVYSNNIGIN